METRFAAFSYRRLYPRLKTPRVDDSPSFCAHIEILPPPTGIPICARLIAQPFGGARSIKLGQNYRLSEFSLRIFPCLMLGIYVDDCYPIEPHDTVQIAPETIRRYADLLRLLLAPGSKVGPTVPGLLIGSNITPTKASIRAEMPPKRPIAISGEIRVFRRPNVLTSDQSAKLIGKLGDIQSLLFPRYGEALLAPTARCQYPRFRKTDQLNSESLLSLRGRLTTLASPIARHIALPPPRPIDVYSAAAGSSLSGVFVAPRKKYYFLHPRSPTWFCKLI